MSASKVINEVYEHTLEDVFLRIAVYRRTERDPMRVQKADEEVNFFRTAV